MGTWSTMTSECYRRRWKNLTKLPHYAMTPRHSLEIHTYPVAILTYITVTTIYLSIYHSHVQTWQGHDTEAHINQYLYIPVQQEDTSFYRYLSFVPVFFYKFGSWNLPDIVAGSANGIWKSVQLCILSSSPFRLSHHSGKLGLLVHLLNRLAF